MSVTSVRHRHRERSATDRTVSVSSMRRRRSWGSVAGVAALIVAAGCSSGGGTGTALPTTTVPPSTTPAVQPVKVPARTGDIGPTAAAELAPVPVVVAYGPDPMHRMDVYATTGDSLGTIMYVHG